jgi:predicted nucleic acid-binding protein
MQTYLFDTNILLRFLDTTAAQHPLVSQAVFKLEAQSHTLKLCPQTIYEFWAVATRPVAANGFGWSLEQTRLEIDKLLNIYELLPDTPAIFTEWLNLVTKHQVSGKQVHDARLAATAKAHKVENLLTLNVDDFKRFNLTAVHPSKVVT